MKFKNKISSLLLSTLLISTIFMGAVSATQKSTDIVMTVNSQKITRAELLDMRSRVDEYVLALGMDMTSIDDKKRLDTLASDEIIKKTVVLQEAKKLGLDKLSKTELEELNSELKKLILNNIDKFSDEVRKNNPELKSKLEINKKAEELYKKSQKDSGLTDEILLQNLIDSKIYSKLQKSVEDTIKISDSDIKNYYQNKLTEQKAEIKKDPANFEKIASSDVIVFAPQDYKFVKHILISVEEEATQEEISEAKKTAELIISELNKGQDFDELILKYGEDPGMTNEPTKSLGYAVSAKSTMYVQEFTDASAKLKNTGDYTKTPVKTQFGFHIIKNIKNQKSGEVAYSLVKDQIKKEYSTRLKEREWNLKVNTLVENAVIIKK